MDDLSHITSVQMDRRAIGHERRRWQADHDHVARAEGLDLLARLATALETDPTLALNSVAGPSLGMALARLDRLRTCSLVGLRSTKPHIRNEAAAELDDVCERTRQVVAEIEHHVNADWYRPDQRRRTARERLPDPETVTKALDHVRHLCQDATDVDPDLPEAHRVDALAAEIARTLTAGPARTCAAPRCTQLLPEAEPGRERRYCSPACRRRAKR